jgi:hypothetical protein
MSEPTLSVVRIENGQAINTSAKPLGYVLPPDGSEMLLADVIAQGIPWAQPPTAPAPRATRLQVRVFLLRHAIPLAQIPAMITALTAEGLEREEALTRWETADQFPKEHPLVAAVAQQLGLDLDNVWNSILAIE